jgi:spoIIIJ-associated protein
MSDTKRRFFSGDTLQQALVQAANHFNLQPEEIAYKAIEKRHGFTKMRRKVVIEVDPANSRRAPEVVVAAARPARPEPPAAPRVAAVGNEGHGHGELTPGGAAADLQGVGAGTGTAMANPASAVEPGIVAQAGLGAGAADRRPQEIDDRRRGASPGRGGERGGSSRGGERGGFSRGGDRGGAGRGGGSGGGEHGRSRRPSGAHPRDRRPGDIGLSEDGVANEPLVALPERPRSISERYPAAEGPQADAAAKGVALLLRIAGLNLTPHIYQGEERLEIDLVGADTDWCFADDGEFLMSIEHLLPRIVRSLSGEAPLCRVDCDNFHEIREERLRSLAQKIADDVRQRGRSRTLVPMNPADRRIVHVTLADDPAVITESEGEGYFKRITVRPA